jgi:O-antigen/teichoic acid export membrane protein
MGFPSSLTDTAMVYTRRLLSSPTVQMISRVSGGNLLAAALGVIGSLVQAYFVGPDDLGYFRQFGIITSYVFFLHLGLWHSLSRRYPLYIGQGRREEALAAAEICQSWNVTLALFTSGIFTVLALPAFAGGNWRAGLAWLAQAVLMLNNFYGGYLGATYRSSHDFVTAAKGSILSGITGILCLPMFPFWPYPGLALRTSFTSLSSLIYLHVRRPLKLGWRFNWREWCQLLKEGLPMFTAGYGSNVGWSALEASLIVKCIGTRSLGLWSASVMMSEMAKIVPQALVAIYNPRLTEQYGRTASVRECFRACWKPMVWGGIGMGIFAAACCPAIPFVLKWLMPKYTEAAVPMCLMLLILPLIVLDMPYALLIATGRLVQQNLGVYIGLACFAACAIGAIRLGWGLSGVVVASVLGRFVRVAMTYVFVYAALRREARDMTAASRRNAPLPHQ